MSIKYDDFILNITNCIQINANCKQTIIIIYKLYIKIANKIC